MLSVDLPESQVDSLDGLPSKNHIYQVLSMKLFLQIIFRERSSV